RREQRGWELPQRLPTGGLPADRPAEGVLVGQKPLHHRPEPEGRPLLGRVGTPGGPCRPVAQPIRPSLASKVGGPLPHRPVPLGIARGPTRQTLQQGQKRLHQRRAFHHPAEQDQPPPRLSRRLQRIHLGLPPPSAGIDRHLPRLARPCPTSRSGPGRPPWSAHHTETGAPRGAPASQRNAARLTSRKAGRRPPAGWPAPPAPRSPRW